MAKKGKFKLEVLKFQALKLRRTYQLPYQLVYYITQLTTESDINWVKCLMDLSEQLLRVNGYYKKYPVAEHDANEEVKNVYKNYFARA